MIRNLEIPRSHPTWGISVSDETIATLMRACDLDSWDTLQITPLSHEQSYNNKIYVIRAGYRSGGCRAYVLKVNGRFFGPAKLENEVSCLLLLEQFCQSLPVPRVLAWSQDGTRVTRRDGHVRSVSIENAPTKPGIPGWILMTHLPGRRLEAFELSTTDMKRLSSQLANVLATWRQQIPLSSCAANIHFQPRLPEAATRDLYPIQPLVGKDLHIYGSIGNGNDFGLSARSPLDYWRAELEWQLVLLSTKPCYASNRDSLLPRLRHFIQTTLPILSMSDQTTQPGFVFTHTDFFPRNILIQGNPPDVSGVVDFEFSGFFPAMEEFVQDWLPETDGSQWPAEMYEMMLEELERCGVGTPRGLSPRKARETQLLNVIRNFVAPWWLADSANDDERAHGLREARVQVMQAVAELEGSSEREK